jgi:hypothetical protein
MADVNTLTENERRVWEFVKKYDFEGTPWSTQAAAKTLELEVDVVYNALAELAKKLKGRIYIYYKDGALRIATE